MKNSIKKVLCTAVAAVSLSALVTVPSSLNKPNSDNAIVNVMEAEAKDALKSKNFKFDTDGSLAVTFELNKDAVKQLNARLTPNGKKVATLKSGVCHNLRFSDIRIEKYTDTENRVWGKTAHTITCDDGVDRLVWVCIYRGIKQDNGLYKPIKQINCMRPDYADKLDGLFKTGALNPSFFWSNGNENKTKIHCYTKNGKSYVDLEK